MSPTPLTDVTNPAATARAGNSHGHPHLAHNHGDSHADRHDGHVHGGSAHEMHTNHGHEASDGPDEIELVPSVVDTDQSTPSANVAAFEAAGELLRALAAPVRIAIVVKLGTGPQCVHDLVEATGAPQPLISQHLRVLRGAGVVRGVRRGREIAYSLTDEHIGHIVADAVSHARETP